jgi:hypothetical protein
MNVRVSFKQVIASVNMVHAAWSAAGSSTQVHVSVWQPDQLEGHTEEVGGGGSLDLAKN